MYVVFYHYSVSQEKYDEYIVLHKQQHVIACAKRFLASEISVLELHTPQGGI